MARTAECDQVFFYVIALLTSSLHVVDLKISQIPAVLASPAVPPEYPLAELVVSAKRKP